MRVAQQYPSLFLSYLCILWPIDLSDCYDALKLLISARLPPAAPRPPRRTVILSCLHLTYSIRPISILYILFIHVKSTGLFPGSHHMLNDTSLSSPSSLLPIFSHLCIPWPTNPSDSYNALEFLLSLPCPPAAHRPPWRTEILSSRSTVWVHPLLPMRTPSLHLTYSIRPISILYILFIHVKSTRHFPGSHHLLYLFIPLTLLHPPKPAESLFPWERLGEGCAALYGPKHAA